MTVAIRYTGPAPARDVAVAVIRSQLLAPQAECAPGTQGFRSSLVPVADLRPGDEK
jgi:hypothetical protein